MKNIFPTFRSTVYPEFRWSLPTDIGVLSIGDAFIQRIHWIDISWIDNRTSLLFGNMLGASFDLDQEHSILM